MAQKSVDAFFADRYAAASHQRIHDIEMEAAGKTRLFDQVRQVLAQLRNSGYKLGIVTRTAVMRSPRCSRTWTNT